jgi:hypothetical protein
MLFDLSLDVQPSMGRIRRSFAPRPFFEQPEVLQLLLVQRRGSLDQLRFVVLVPKLL